MCRLPEQGFVLPIRQKAHLEQHTRQGARAENIEMCSARRHRDHPHVIGELFDHAVLEPGGPRRRLRFGRRQGLRDAAGIASAGRQLCRRAAAAADIDAGAASTVIVRGIGMDRYQQVGAMTPRESQALGQRDGAVPGPRQCDTIAAGSLQLTPQLLRGRECDGLFQRPRCADGAGVAPAMAGIDDDQRAAGQVVPWPDLACGSVLLHLGGTRVRDGCSHRLSGLRSMVRRTG